MLSRIDRLGQRLSREAPHDSHRPALDDRDAPVEARDAEVVFALKVNHAGHIAPQRQRPALRLERQRMPRVNDAVGAACEELVGFRIHQHARHWLAVTDDLRRWELWRLGRAVKLRELCVGGFERGAAEEEESGEAAPRHETDAVGV